MHTEVFTGKEGRCLQLNLQRLRTCVRARVRACVCVEKEDGREEERQDVLANRAECRYMSGESG